MCTKQQVDENNKSFLLQKIEDNGKIIMFLFGVVFFVIHVTYNICSDYGGLWKSVVEVLGQIGGVFISTSAVAFFYDKYRDKKQKAKIQEHFEEHKEALAQERNEVLDKWIDIHKKNTKDCIKLLSKGKQEKVYVECIDKEFVNIIPREELDKNVDYRFEAMTKKMAAQSDVCKRNPILIYGSTLGFLDWIDEEKKAGNEVNKKALIDAVNKGVHFKLALNTPEVINTNNIDEDKEKRKTINNVVNSLKSIIAEDLSDAKGSIDLRYIPILEKNSFSSFVCDGRRVSVLDFNFENNSKLSQIFDEKVTTQDDSKNLASLLAQSYGSAHKKGIPCICYNIHKMKIYIIGICNNKILMCQNESDFTSGLTIPHVSITGNGKVNDNLGTSNNVPDDIYEKISSVYKEMTNCDIRLYEFVSQKNHNDCCICFVIGRISFGDIENEKVQLRNVYDNKKRYIFGRYIDHNEIGHSYLCKLQNVLRCYGIDNN